MESSIDLARHRWIKLSATGRSALTACVNCQLRLAHVERALHEFLELVDVGIELVRSTPEYVINETYHNPDQGIVIVPAEDSLVQVDGCPT